MKLILGSFYYEKGIRFNISYKVHKLIKEALVREVFSSSERIGKLEERAFFKIELSARKNVNIVDIGEPIIDRNKSIEFFVLLPYSETYCLWIGDPN